MCQIEDIVIKQIPYWLGKRLIDSYARLMLKLDIHWEDPLPVGPKIVAPNHPTTTDPFLVFALLSERVTILINETLFKVPLFGAYLRHLGHIPVPMGHGSEAFKQAKRLLENGHTVVVFPEGRCSPEGGFARPHTGAARLSLLTGAPVIPIGINLNHARIRRINTQIDGQKETVLWYFRGPYALTVGKAMHFEGNTQNRPHVREISGQIMERIKDLAQHSALRLQDKAPITPS